MKIEPFRLERYFAKYEFSAPYLLCSSDCESVSVKELLALEPGSSEQLTELWLGYTESLRNLDLREAIAHHYEKVRSDDLLVHAGAQEAIFNFMMVTVKPSDHVIVTAPCYQSLGEVAVSLGAKVEWWQGIQEEGWRFDLTDLKAMLTPRTRLVVVNFPHNPTGFLPDAAFMRELSELSEEYGFLIFSDEVYRGLELDPAHRLPAMADLNERAVSLGVMSKTYGLAGLRIGWTATRNAPLLRELASFKDYTTICASAPSELLATIALRHADELLARNLRIIRSNLKLLDTFFAAHEELFEWTRPKGGTVAFPTLKGQKVDEFCKTLVEEAGVLLLPGTLYAPYLNTFRVGYGRKNLPEALSHFEEHLKQ